MKKICIYLLLLVSTSSFGQVNLVPNPSFEDTVACPNSTNQVDRAIGWHSSGNSPDYFNECDWFTGSLGVPNNYFGFQFAHSGVAYCGLILYANGGINYKERFTAQLINTLTIGEKYWISFYLSWAGTFSNRIACNKIGALFSTIDYNFNNPTPLNNYCQFYTDSIISDSLNWVLVTGSFVADSNYLFISIGSFFDDLNTDTLHYGAGNQAFYYIDDISVIKDTVTSLFNFMPNKEIRIYPNPFIDKLNIGTQDNGISNISILNADGQKLKVLKNETENEKKEYQFNLIDLKKGIYILKVTYLNKTSTFYKLIKI